jgi:CBS domain-containing protein
VGKKPIDDRHVPAGSEPTPHSRVAKHAAEHKDSFVQLMFFQGSRPADAATSGPHPAKASGSYAPLPHSTASPGDAYSLPVPSSAGAVALDSPASDVMTDLRRISAVTIDPYKSIVEAHQFMIARGVRSLFVVNGARKILGLVTATDVLGERPIQVAQGRGIRHDEVLASDIMTPADRLEVLAFNDVLRARVGDIVATLKLAGRQHALVVEAAEGAAGRQLTARGVFSLTQIARQLGIAPQVHDIARTFAEIEAIIAP